MRLLADLAWLVAYWVVFTPLAWVFRRVRPDPLRMGPSQAASFWRPRTGGRFRPMTSRY